MIRVRTLRDASVLAWLFAATLVAQQPPAQTCSIAGDVADEAGQPVSNATIVLVPADDQKWAAGREANLVQWAAVDAGKFKLTGFPPGEYKLAVTAEKIAETGPDVTLIKTLAARGFPLTASAGGQAQVRLFVNAELKLVRVAGSATVLRSSGPPSPTLPAGTGTAGMRVSGPANLPPPPRGPGAISGTVTDAAGRPVAGAHLQRFIAIPRPGTMQFLPSGQSTTTDEHGVYHLTGLTPGESVVAALARSPDLSSPGVPMIEHMPPPATQPGGRKLGYVTTYYPGTDTIARATKVSVATTEVTGLNFSLQRQPVVDVSGALTATASGTALTAFGDVVILIPAAQANGGMAVDTRRVPMDRDGHFAFTDVPLGTYVLNFTSSGGWAHETLTVSEATAPLTIALQAPFVVKGRVEFLGETPPPPTETSLKPFRVRLVPAVTVPGARSFEVPISAKGEFAFKGVPLARYILQSVTTPPWAEISGTLGGRDTLDTPVDVTSDRDDAVVVLADREAGVTGTVRDDASRDALIVIYSADRQFWTSGSRRVRVSRIVAGGGFSVSSLPPGQYLAIALPLTSDGPPVNNALLETYQATAQRFVLIAREHKTIEIQMIR